MKKFPNLDPDWQADLPKTILWVLLGVVAMGGVFFFGPNAVVGRCPADKMRVGQALNESRGRVLGPEAASRSDHCDAYRGHVAFIAEAKKVAASCGSVEDFTWNRSTGLSGDFPHLAAEQAFYERLISEKCPKDAAP